ncbi:MAG TPA: LPS export ABC transporter periplasmic protein LptC, partial [Methylophilaceae bacterium]|nr:LPS export ABC transporter periplasmic protein LptC [Methylophilaceae bacterium]
IILPLVVLVLLAAITFWIDRTVQAPVFKPNGDKRHDPDYIVNNFVTTKTDVNGDVQYVLAAAEMRHYPDDDSTQLERPRLTQYVAAKPYTQIESQQGLVSSDGEVVQFIGNVKVVRQATAEKAEMTMRTQYLKVVPDTEVATTDRPVVITEGPKSVVNAVGMIYDKKKRTIQLLNKVRAHYEQPAKGVKRRAAAATTSRPAASRAETKIVPKKSAPANASAKPRNDNRRTQ